MAFTGTVKWYNPTKGYGFIVPDDGANDVFVHATAVQRANLEMVVEGQRLEYELEDNRGKVSATNLKIVD